MEKALMDSKLDSVVQTIAQSKGTVMLIGSTDCGKTTTAKYMLTKLCSISSKIGFIDSDIGQSTLGPPGTIGAATFSKFNPQKDCEMQAQNLKLTFIGEFTPVGHIMELIFGIKKMLDYLNQLNCAIILIDTTGLVHGKTGLYLKKSKIELIKPDHLIFFHKNKDLLTLINIQTKAQNHFLTILDSVKTRSFEQRRSYRNRKITTYFKDSREQPIAFPPIIQWRKDIITCSALSPAEIGRLTSLLQREIYFAAISHRTLIIASDSWFYCYILHKIKEILPIDFIYILNKQQLISKYISIEDSNYDVLALGIVKDVDFKKQIFKLLSPDINSTKIQCLKFGTINMCRSGN